MSKIISNYSNETYAAIEEFAAQLATPEQISMILDIDWLTFREELRNKESLIFKAFNKGLLRAQLELNKIQISLAKSGSPSGLEFVREKLNDMSDGF